MPRGQELVFEQLQAELDLPCEVGLRAPWPPARGWWLAGNGCRIWYRPTPAPAADSRLRRPPLSRYTFAVLKIHFCFVEERVVR